MEEERRINWLSLLIKVIIIFVFALIIIWIISKIINKKELSDTFKSNLDNMEKISIEYFKSIDLPEEKGKNIKITLGEMIEKKLIISEKKESDNSCDKEKSYAKITREKDNYIVDVTLKCGKEKDTKTSKFSFEDCKNCNNNITDNQNDDNKNDNDNNTNNATSNNSNQDNISNSNGTTYYEYVKENISYSKWMRGSRTGENIENKYEYYSTSNKIYYTVGYLTKKDINKNNKLSYTIKLNDVPNKDYYFTSVIESSNFKKSEISNYLAKDSIFINSSIKSENEDAILNYYLEDNNFTYNLSPYYRKGSFYVDVDIVIKDKDNIEYYHDTSLNEEITIIPLKINIKFISNKMMETKPYGDYDTIPYYRYVEKTRDIVWSTDTSLDGYTKTGNTKIQ